MAIVKRIRGKNCSWPESPEPGYRGHQPTTRRRRTVASGDSPPERCSARTLKCTRAKASAESAFDPTAKSFRPASSRTDSQCWRAISSCSTKVTPRRSPQPEEHLGSGRNSLRILLYSEVRHAQGDTASNSDWTLLIKKPEPMVIVPEFWDALVVLKASMASSEET